MSKPSYPTLKVSAKQMRIIRLVGKGINDLDKIASEIGLSREDLMRDVEELREKRILAIRKEKEQRASLTSEGERYLKLGLPERRALHLLLVTELGGGIEAEDIIKEANKRGVELSSKEVSIALQYLTKNGVIRISDGKIFLVKEKASSFVRDCERIEGLLKRISEGKKVDDPKTLSLLRRRRLIDVRTITRLRLELTSEARNLLSKDLIQEVKIITVLTPKVLEERSWIGAEFKEYEIDIAPPKIFPGRKHPYLELLDEIREILVSMGFEEMKGPKVELELWNFDALFQAQDHPAREIHDTYFLKRPRYGDFRDEELMKRIAATHEDGWKTGSKGWGYRWDPRKALRLILRTQTTAVSARTLYFKGDGEYRCFSLDRVFRPENLDAKHSMEFYQLEGIIVGKDVNFRHLIGFFYEIAKKLDLGEVKIKPAYFPFTEPSVEGFIKHRKLGWIEVFPGGMFRPEMLAPLGISESKVAAWGIGIDRIAMTILGIDDIRLLFTQDLQFLRGQKKPMISSLVR